MEKYLPKNKEFALLEIRGNSLYFIKESDDLEALIKKQERPKLDCSYYVINKDTKFQHKLSIHQALDLKSVKI